MAAWSALSSELAGVVCETLKIFLRIANGLDTFLRRFSFCRFEPGPQDHHWRPDGF
jgi:hypothetical protein